MIRFYQSEVYMGVNPKIEYFTERLEHKSWDHTAPTPSVNFTNISWQNSRHGSSLPGWKNAIKKGVDATTTLVGVKTVVTHTPGHMEWQGCVTGFPHLRRLYGRSGDLDQFNPTIYLPIYASAARAESIASSDFIKKYSNIIKSLEGLETLAELPKTARSIMQRTTQMVGLLVNWRRTLSRGLSASRRGNRANAARAVAGAVADAHLEWQFAYNPLVRDISDLGKKLSDDTLIVPFRASGKASADRLTPTESGSGHGVLGWDSHTVCTEETSIRYKGAVKIRREGASGFLGQLGISPSNFVPTIYNLLPWTYMIDYFTNVGDMISAVSQPTPELAWVNRSIRSKVSLKNVAGINPTYSDQFTADPGYPICVPSTLSCEITHVTRNSQRPNFIPSFHMKLPNLESESGRKKWANVAAVIAARTWGNSTVSAHLR